MKSSSFSSLLFSSLGLRGRERRARRSKQSMQTKPIIYSLGIALVSTHSILAQDVLPKLEQAFTDAKIGRTYKDSQPGTMVLTKAPAGAPNVLFILIDDAGFGQWGTFGGQVPT